MGNLLKPAVNQTAYLKLGLQGFEGSGKTYLANEFALGLAKLTGNKKVAFFDTEKGSDFWIPKYKAAGVELHVARTRAFSDLLTVIREAEAAGFGFIVIDSITHVWRELQTSWLKRNNKKEMSMKAWVALKTEWGQYTDLYVNSKIHIAMCGRAGYEYDQEENEDTGKKEIIKTGTKMRAEGETGFEPDLLIETFKVPLAETLTDKRAAKKAKGFVNRCVVIKDRSDLLNARMFDKPKFKDFLPVINFLNLGGEHAGADTTRNSEQMFDSPDWSRSNRERQVAILVEELQALLIKGKMDGTSTAAKEKRVETLERIFGTSAKTAIEGMHPDQLRDGVARLRQELAQAQGHTVAPEATKPTAQQPQPEAF